MQHKGLTNKCKHRFYLFSLVSTIIVENTIYSRRVGTCPAGDNRTRKLQGVIQMTIFDRRQSWRFIVSRHVDCSCSSHSSADSALTHGIAVIESRNMSFKRFRSDAKLIPIFHTNKFCNSFRTYVNPVKF